jgi:hypothetical protein
MKKFLIITVLFLSVISKINAEEWEWYQFTHFESTSTIVKQTESSDKYITDKITTLTKEGWTLVFITPYAINTGTSGVGGIYTRYLFKREKK